MSKEEELEQKEFIKWLDTNKLFYFAVVNENKQSSTNKNMALRIAAKSKSMGKKSGVSDLVVFTQDKILFIEMKRQRKKLKSGKLSSEKLSSDEQDKFIENVSKYDYADGRVCYGAVEAIEFVKMFKY